MRSTEKGAAVLAADGFMTDAPCWVDTARADPETAVAFYSGVFGWEFEDRAPAGAPRSSSGARARGREAAAVGSRAAREPAAPAWNTSIRVDSVDDAAATVDDAGGTVLMEPFDVLDAGRMAVVADPGGAVFFLWQEKSQEGWSELYTRHLAAARAFYAELFGCEPDEGGDGHGPPYSNVTFAVDDPDAIADRAVELGGEVVVPPSDGPHARIAVLRDPDGAVFSIERLGPNRAAM